MLTEDRLENQKVDESTKASTLNEKVVEMPNNNVSTGQFDGTIDLTATRKKRFNINRDTGNDGVLYLDTSDFGIITRLNDLYPRLQQLAQKASQEKIAEQNANEETLITQMSKVLKNIDFEMRNILDEIFDSNVSEICAPNGTMFDPFNGQFRFEYIIETLLKQYTSNINAEYKKMAAKLKKRTSKYTSGR